MSRKILMTMVAAIAIVALTFGLSLLAASCSDDETAAGSGRVAQMRGDGPGDGRGCQGRAQDCGRAADCRVADNAGACDVACDGACDGSACTGTCDGACDPCAEAGGASPFGDEPICF